MNLALISFLFFYRGFYNEVFYEGARAKSVMNPNISLVLDGIGAFEVKKSKAYFLSRNELFFESAVDPFFWGYLSADLHISPEFKTELDIDEVYVKTTPVPSFSFSLGKARSDVAYVNTKHTEFLKFSDFPVSFKEWVDGMVEEEEGGEGQEQTQHHIFEERTLHSILKVRFVPPIPLLLFGEVLLSHKPSFPVGVQIPVAVGKGEFLLLGSTVFSEKYRPRESSSFGLVFKYFKSYYTKFGLAGEWFIRTFYVEFFSLFERRYEVALRFDRPTGISIISFSFAFLPSDFSRLRFELSSELSENLAFRLNFLTLQLTFSLGPHGAHRF